VTPRGGDGTPKEFTVSPSPNWYLDQAATYYARADECRRLARELDLSPLPDLLARAGAETWQCPAAEEFREQVLIGQAQILDAIADLETNAYGLANDGDHMTREASAEVARRRQAAAVGEAERRERDRDALVAD
jgi:hypothetical protein